ncbi:alpha/beta-hydrolase [Auricularia subglabra TFB-10046 SS5]|uniref:Alpha/beta-hydrolase n=1 Tax=Auricularia subglabra (strain TFB-10046 / SS5) TaxID=717982 RepID=J0WT41_AURST|nr:alpha/beta-hydrolase [Auricularia subglabra TFB-10046 SS5]
MLFARVLALASLTAAAVAVDQATYDSLVHYFKYAASTYATACAYPNGQTLVSTFSDKKTDTQGFISRDDVRQEFVIAFRGSTNLKDAKQFNETELVDYPGVSGDHPPRVHKGFINAYNSVKPTIVNTITSALVGQHAHYALVAVGHDSGGALAVLTGPTLRNTFIDNRSQVYTYGQPRTGDLQFAFFIDELMGFSVHRAVNKKDGIPKIIPLDVENGYVHHPAEYWTGADPPSAATTVGCREFGEAVVGEDELCSLSVNTHLPNADHYVYYGIPVTQSFCTP